MITATLETGVSVRLDAIPSEVDKLTFVAAFLTYQQMRRLFTGSQSAAVASALGLTPNKSEATNCRNIEAYYKGQPT